MSADSCACSPSSSGVERQCAGQLIPVSPRPQPGQRNRGSRTVTPPNGVATWRDRQSLTWHRPPQLAHCGRSAAWSRACAATTACWTRASSRLASGSVSPSFAMSLRSPGRLSSISSTLRVRPSARVSTSCNAKPIHDLPAGYGPTGHIAPVRTPPTSGHSLDGAGHAVAVEVEPRAVADQLEAEVFQRAGDEAGVAHWVAEPLDLGVVAVADDECDAPAGLGAGGCRAGDQEQQGREKAAHQVQAVIARNSTRRSSASVALSAPVPTRFWLE